MLNFLYTAVSWVLLRWHQALTFLGMPENSGWNWALSIVLLVITARLLLFRFFIKQVHSQRKMQAMQPKIQALKEKYKNDKAEQQRQMMKLQQEEGFNPVAGCLPLVLQLPVFIGLYHTLRHLANSAGIDPNTTDPTKLRLLTLYGFTKQQTLDAAHARIFNAPLAASFKESAQVIRNLGGDPTSTRTLIVPLLVLSALATFLTQFISMRNAPTAPVGQAALIQKAMLYVIPFGVIGSGLLFFFPLGVLLYWFTSNNWTLGQQLYIQRFHPHEGKNAPPAGELGRTLRPQAGQKPQVGQKPQPGQKPAVGKTGTPQRPANPPPNADVPDTAPDLPPTAGGPAKDAPARPRQPQRPSRPSGGSRPANRPSKAKKRR